MGKLGTWIAAGLALALTATLAVAQTNLFKPVITVNDRVITNYELGQRELFLTLLRAPGNPADEAPRALIDERLFLEAGKVLGVLPSTEQVDEGMAEFAGRANLSAAEFITALEGAGVSEESFRDFIRAGVTWRTVVQQRFGPRAQVTDAEIDRALALAGQNGGARVLLSEIVLPGTTPEEIEASTALAARLKDQIGSEGAFAAAARRYSIAETAPRGGRLNWIPLASLPPQVVPLLLALGLGRASDPIPVGGGISIFLVRDLEELEPGEAQTVALEYATLALAGGRSPSTLAEAERIRESVDTCDDLYGVAQRLPEGALERTVAAVSEVPNDIALELAKLDQNEVSTNLTRAQGEALLFVMLCGRTNELSEGNRDTIRASLINQRLAAYATGYLEELRADAVITEVE